MTLYIYLNFPLFLEFFFDLLDLHVNSFLFYTEYTIILIFLLIAVLLAVLIIFLSYFFAIQNPETEKLSSYECGFEPYEDARHIFDVKFYFVRFYYKIHQNFCMVSCEKKNLFHLWLTRPIFWPTRIIMLKATFL